MTELSDIQGPDPAETDNGDMVENDAYHGYSVDSEDQPSGDGDSLSPDRGLTEPLDEGYSPPEKWSVAEGYGNTPLEEELGETLDQRLAQEVPEPDPYAEAEVTRDLVDGEVGDERAGRLVEPDEGVREDDEAGMVATDVGIDGAGAGAEEAAVHVVDDDSELTEDLSGYDLADPEADALAEEGLADGDLAQGDLAVDTAPLAEDDDLED